ALLSARRRWGFQSTPSAREGDGQHHLHAASLPAFQSTPSAREGDVSLHSLLACEVIVSIHAFREGRRRIPQPVDRLLHMFQSTPSAREGDQRAPDCAHQQQVSIHAFREGRRRA
ncbi:MAG: hypothetical protein N2385_14705, partial [Chloroflexus sp.]|nr:hypothetical protein [Chloroflexus sp.]